MNPNDIVVLKFLNQMFVVGKFVSTDDKNIVLRKSQVLIPQQDGQSSLIDYAMAFPYFDSQDERSFNISSIETMGKAERNLEEKYKEITSSIIMPTAKLILE